MAKRRSKADFHPLNQKRDLAIVICKAGCTHWTQPEGFLDDAMDHENWKRAYILRDQAWVFAVLFRQSNEHYEISGEIAGRKEAV